MSPIDRKFSKITSHAVQCSARLQRIYLKFISYNMLRRAMTNIRVTPEGTQCVGESEYISVIAQLIVL